MIPAACASFRTKQKNLKIIDLSLYDRQVGYNINGGTEDETEQA
jgi:hypothetical protein